MTLAQSRILFMSPERSDSWISRETGIPTSTVGFVRRGERTLPAMYEAELRKLYQREAYRQLRETGFSYHEARRFSSYVPEAAKSRIEEMNYIVGESAKGYAGTLKKKAEEEGEFFDFEAMQKDIFATMQDAYRGSRKSWEEIQKYPVAQLWTEFEEEEI